MTAYCPECDRDLPQAAFKQNEHLVDDRWPWCEDCTVRAQTSHDARARHRRAYQRAYYARLRERSPRRCPKVRLRWYGHDVLAGYSDKTCTARVTASSDAREDVVALLVDVIGAGGAVVVGGRGGGSGVAEHPEIVAEAPCERESWDEWERSLGRAEAGEETVT